MSLFGLEKFVVVIMLSPLRIFVFIEKVNLSSLYNVNLSSLIVVLFSEDTSPLFLSTVTSSDLNLYLFSMLISVEPVENIFSSLIK